MHNALRNGMILYYDNHMAHNIVYIFMHIIPTISTVIVYTYTYIIIVQYLLMSILNNTHVLLTIF